MVCLHIVVFVSEKLLPLKSSLHIKKNLDRKAKLFTSSFGGCCARLHVLCDVCAATELSYK
jgi:hypothetical protein